VSRASKPFKASRLSRFLFIGLAGLALIVSACQAAATPPPATPTTAVRQLRISNTGSVDMENLVVLFPEDRIDFGAIPAGQTTEYQPVPNGVYSYAAYELTVNGEKVDLPVIDWVGAEPMPGETFTYVLELDPEAGRWEMLQVVEVKTDR